MAPVAIDGGFSGLLCVEDNTSVFFDENEDSGAVHSSDTARHHRSSHRNGGFGEAEDGFLAAPPPPLQSEDCLVKLLEKEQQHMPNGDYVNRLRNGDLAACGRTEAIDWIKMAHAHFSFGPLCAYLSVSYLDRFLSVYDLPKGIAWVTQLLAVACLSLATKVEEIDVPSSLDLQRDESKYIFEARTVQRMELLVLSKLSWRMQSVTPFSFLDHFVMTMIDGGDKLLPKSAAIQRSIQIISSTIGAIDFLEFKASEISAAVAVSVLGDTDTQRVDTKKPLLSSLLSQHVEKNKVVRCLDLIHGLVSTTGSTKKTTLVSATSIPRSPIGVLDSTCFSYKSGDETTIGSCACSSQDNVSGSSKRRKIERQGNKG